MTVVAHGGLTVIDQSVARHLGRASRGVVVVPRGTSRWWRLRRTGEWRPLDPERVLELLCDLPRPSVVLARPVSADPGAACLARAAAVVGHDVITLPAALDEAVWSVGVMLGLAACERETPGRVPDVICCGPASAHALPHQAWGPTGLSVPALRPAVLARWAYCAWHPCSWCDAGGLPGLRCRRCGAPVHGTPTAAAA